MNLLKLLNTEVKLPYWQFALIIGLARVASRLLRDLIGW